ncbi:hypothetical protein BH160DRAFT_3908 [Burkholderia sp. H160]|nr:hypothetical protein BH160DRAFT_3908 [Burkholderia sp. H160]
MRHELGWLEPAAFWIHVVIAVVMLAFVIGRSYGPIIKDWMLNEGQSITVNFSAVPVEPVLTPQPQQQAQPRQSGSSS